MCSSLDSVRRDASLAVRIEGITPVMFPGAVGTSWANSHTESLASITARDHGNVAAFAADVRRRQMLPNPSQGIWCRATPCTFYIVYHDGCTRVCLLRYRLAGAGKVAFVFTYTYTVLIYTQIRFH